MSGAGAMSVHAQSSTLEGCTADECEACRRFATTFVLAAASVIAGAKPAALFSFALGACRATCVGRAVSTYCRELLAHGIVLVPISTLRRRLMVFAYRPALVGRVIADGPSRGFLAARGYDTGSPDAAARSVCVRLGAYYAACRCGEPAEFPHECGLLLGYPLEDVIGFIRGDRETCRGPWKAYGNPDLAQRRFTEFLRCERRYKQRFRSGEPLSGLLSPELEDGCLTKEERA